MDPGISHTSLGPGCGRGVRHGPRHGARLVRASRLANRPIVFCALLAAVACSGDGNGPVGPTPPTTTPAPTARSLDISGAMSLAHPGETSQLTARVRMSDDTTRDVTAEAEWTVMPEGVATVSRGLLTAIGYGKSNLTVHYPPLSVLVRTVRVAPAGTFVLNGTLTEAGTDFPIDLAEVEVTSASGMLTTMTDTTGRYMLAPVSTDAIVRAEKDGFEPAVKRWVGERDEELDLELRRSSDSGDLLGVYELTIAASSSCALPFRGHAEDVQGAHRGAGQESHRAPGGRGFRRIVGGNRPDRIQRHAGRERRPVRDQQRLRFGLLRRGAVRTGKGRLLLGDRNRDGRRQQSERGVQRHDCGARLRMGAAGRAAWPVRGGGSPTGVREVSNAWVVPGRSVTRRDRGKRVGAEKR